MFGDSSVICAPRRRGRRVAQAVRVNASGRFRHLRVAQLHLARRVSSLFITRAAQDR
ncbi:hypothetical protein A2U01_0073681, partial [Trifolium medium]|nr:hypothetical protein [Trifolium medium]